MTDRPTLFEAIFPECSVFDNFDFEHTLPVIGRRLLLLLNARQLQTTGRYGELLALVTLKRRCSKQAPCRAPFFNSANFSSMVIDEKEVIHIFNVGAKRMLCSAASVGAA